MRIISFSSGLGNQIYVYLFYKYIESIYPNEKIFGYYSKKNLAKHNGLEVEKVFDIKLPPETYFSKACAFLVRTLNRLGCRSVRSGDSPFNPNAIMFDGWWQDKKYYLSNVDDLTFRPTQLDSINQKLKEDIEGSESVSIHIRRGDYLDPVFLTRGGYCSLEYYQNAIEIVKRKHSKPKFFIFSNDIEWCKENLLLNDATYITNNVGANSYLDMYLMTMCKTNILANSSFSYWGARLNKQKNHTVIYPAKWFHTQTPNIFPDNWIGIDGLK